MEDSSQPELMSMTEGLNVRRGKKGIKEVFEDGAVVVGGGAGMR